MLRSTRSQIRLAPRAKKSTVAACLALAQFLDPSTVRDWLYPALLTVLDIGMAGTRLRLPRLRGSLVVSDLLTLGAVVSIPVFMAPFVASVIAMATSRLEPTERGSATGTPLRILATALTAAVVSATYAWLILYVPGEVALAAAGLLYLSVSVLGGSLGDLAAYRGCVLWWRVKSSLALGALFAPAAPFTALASELISFSSDAPALWVASPLFVALYTVLDTHWGPVCVDTLKRDEVEALCLRAVEALALAVEAKDSVSGMHLKRVQFYSVEIGNAPNCCESEVRALEFGVLLHGIGKIAVPEELLNKPSCLSPQEFSQAASHVEIGAETLPTARILTVVDNFDALTSDRPYRAALTVESAVETLLFRRGSLFDPRVVNALVELLPQLKAELRRDPEFVRGRFDTSHPPKREVPLVEQASLTPQERLESLKQSRTVARQPTDLVLSGALTRL